MSNTQSPRAGRTILQLSGYRAYSPQPLPPQPPLVLDGPTLALLSASDRDLARLDAIAELLPNPDLFVAMYVRHEAVLSSQIEGTQSTLEDVLAFEVLDGDNQRPKDVAEVVNYVRAMNHGLRRLHELPLSLRLVREIHGELMTGVRGSERSPGEFRTSQNWIGGARSTLANAAFVPPPPHELMGHLGALECYLHDARGDLPLLVRCALVHAQFETIHPFLDGNGRVGRLLITFMLCEEKALSRPLLYLSIYLKANRAEYYDRLTAIRLHGHWEQWVNFFLRGVGETARLATQTARAIVALRNLHRERYGDSLRILKLIDALFEQPLVTVRRVQGICDCANDTALRLVRKLVAEGLLRETTGLGRNRLFEYEPYLRLFQSEGSQPEDSADEVADTAVHRARTRR